VYAAPVLAANSVLRSLFGAAFRLLTSHMYDYIYDDLGMHWASSIPAFLSLACVPPPYLFYRYGAAIRKRCKFTTEAAEMLKKMQQTGEKRRTVNQQGKNQISLNSELYKLYMMN
jgi:hypothetical protein